MSSDAYKKGYDEGLAAAVVAMREAYEPILEATSKDSERLDWMFSLQCPSWFKTRDAIDKAMAENAEAGEGES